MDRIADMEASPQADTAPKEKPDKNPMSTNAPATGSETVVGVKKEDTENGRVDPTLAIFDDVDNNSEEEGPEFVDVDHVGFVDHNGVNCWVCPGFRIPQIPEVSVVKRPLKDLCDAIRTNDIVLDPNYQRDVVWDDMRAEGLIVSLLMGYLPPPIIFNVKLQITETPNGKLRKHIRTCVDGKQRLTSILRFMRGEIGFLDSKHKKWYYEQPTANGKKVTGADSILPTEVKNFFLSRFFICYEYNELSQSTEEEMFQLVQRGIALTPAEKMRAMSTEWAEFTRQYEEDYSMIINLSKQGRASGFRLTLTIFAMVQEVMSNRRKNNSVPTLQASPQALTRMLEEKEPINPVLKLRLKAVFDRYEKLVKLSSSKVTAKKYKVNVDSVFDTAPDFLRGEGFDHVRTFSPLELISTGILICYHMEKRTDAQLLNDVKEMRRHLRIKHKDLRVNAQCWATVWEFITKVGSSDSVTPEIAENSNSNIVNGNDASDACVSSSETSSNSEESAGSVATAETLSSRSSPSISTSRNADLSQGNRVSRSVPQAKLVNSAKRRRGRFRSGASTKHAVSKTTAFTETARGSKEHGISALGQASAGSDASGETNSPDRANSTNCNGSCGGFKSICQNQHAIGLNSKDYRSANSSRRSARSGLAIPTAHTVGTSTRVTRGRPELTTVKDGTGTVVKVISPANSSAATNGIGIEIDEGSSSTSSTDVENSMTISEEDHTVIDDDESDGSLSSVPSSAISSPEPSPKLHELGVHMGKRPLGDGGNTLLDIRGKKKLKH